MRGVPTRRYSLLPPAEGRLPALLPLAGEGGAKRRMRGASAASCSCSFLVWQQPNQDQELSRRDGASHLSLLVQRNLAQTKHTPPLRPVRCTGSAQGARRSRSPAPATAVGRAFVTRTEARV